MTEDIKTYINESLTNAGLNYAFMQWEDDIKYPYWIGDGEEVEVDNEASYHEYNFRLTGTTRKTYKELDKERETIEKLFSSITTTLPDGTGVVFYYEGARPIPTGEAELKRIQINLKIQEWRVE